MEVGRHGVRAVTLQTSGIPETIPEDFDGRDEIVDGIVGTTMLRRAATLEDVGNVAVFVASDRARMLTGTQINMTGGSQVD